MVRLLQQKGHWRGGLRRERSFSFIFLSQLPFTFLFFHPFILSAGFLENDWDDDGDEGSTSEVTSDPPRYAPQCQWAPLSDLDPDTLAFPGGAPVQLHTVPLGLLPRIPHFYVCTRCGKVFWEGSHFERVLALFQGVLNVADGEDEAD